MARGLVGRTKVYLGIVGERGRPSNTGQEVVTGQLERAKMLVGRCSGQVGRTQMCLGRGVGQVGGIKMYVGRLGRVTRE